MSIKQVSNDSFDADVLKAEAPVLVDYWAEWCGPCKMIAPILDEVSRDYAEKLNVAKVNVDENQEIASKYGIRGIPTLMLFRNGAVVATKVGALSKSQHPAVLDSNLDPCARREPGQRPPRKYLRVQVAPASSGARVHPLAPCHFPEPPSRHRLRLRRRPHCGRRPSAGTFAPR